MQQGVPAYSGGRQTPPRPAFGFVPREQEQILSDEVPRPFLSAGALSVRFRFALVIETMNTLTMLHRIGTIHALHSRVQIITKRGRGPQCLNAHFVVVVSIQQSTGPD